MGRGPLADQAPVIDAFLNRFLVRIRPFSHLAATRFLIARLDPCRRPSGVGRNAAVSVIVPARNEAGSIEEILERVPR